MYWCLRIDEGWARLNLPQFEVSVELGEVQGVLNFPGEKPALTRLVLLIDERDRFLMSVLVKLARVCAVNLPKVQIFRPTTAVCCGERSLVGRARIEEDDTAAETSCAKTGSELANRGI